jgi:hypothetical protein
MNFDKTRYVADYITPRRKAQSLPDDDLVDRYSLTLPATDADIATQIKAVRAYWNAQRPGTAAAAICRLCKTEDERLQAQHGPAMLTATWWQQRAAQEQEAAKVKIAEIAEHLKAGYGQLGVVTRGVVEGFAGRRGVRPADGEEAARLAGLRVVDAPQFGTAAPIEKTRFVALCGNLAAAGAPTIPEFLHPGSGPFTLLTRYSCLGDPALRLDALAVQRQVDEADKQGTSAINTARQRALGELSHAVSAGVNLDGLALHHLISSVSESISLGSAVVQSDLVKLGLERTEAAIVAVGLAEQSTTAGVAGVAQVEKLLGEGRLNEAEQAARSIPAESESRDPAIARVREARDRLQSLIAAAREAVAVPDEVRATELLREAAAISAEDAEEAMSAVPPAPPNALRLTADAGSVSVYWQPGAGHPDDTTYVVTRSDRRPPVTPADGQRLAQQPANSFRDGEPPVARTVFYSVFATTTGRPTSRPATQSIMVLPEVMDLAADVGPSEVTLHWSAHPLAHQIEAVHSTAGGAPAPVAVRGNSCGLTGLAEGRPLHFEIVAVYQGQDGRLLRSRPARINATPRSEAGPIGKLRARPIDVGGEVRVRVSWTPVDNSDVRVVRSAQPAPWAPGTWIQADELARFGTEVSGRRIAGRSENAIEAELPPGVHHLAAFSTGGTGTVVGAATVVGVTDPVADLKATVFSDHAVLSWSWPPSSQLAEVSWELDDDADLFVIGKDAEYNAGRPPKVPLGRGPCHVQVRALIQVGAASFPSPPAELDIDARTETEIGYRIASTPSVLKFGGRSKKVTFLSSQGCRGLRVRVIAATGPVMPTSVEQGVVLLDLPLELAAGVPSTHTVTVPKSIPRPFWVRGFLAGSGRLVDPPITQLKES